MRKIMLFSTLSLMLSLSATAHADITIYNNTAAYSTGSLPASPCSTILGSRGVINPHSTAIVPQSGINTFCATGPCEASVYMTNNCSGKVVALVKVDKDKGVFSITNYDREHYVVSGHGNQVNIESAK